jgi:hypothetical protein
MQLVFSPLRLISTSACLPLLLCAAASALCGASSPEPEALRGSALDDLFVPRGYTSIATSTGLVSCSDQKWGSEYGAESLFEKDH